MNKRIKDSGRIEGCIYEQFVYFSKSGVYPNSSGMNKVCDIVQEVP